MKLPETMPVLVRDQSQGPGSGSETKSGSKRETGQKLRTVSGRQGPAKRELGPQSISPWSTPTGAARRGVCAQQAPGAPPAAGALATGQRCRPASLPAGSFCSPRHHRARSPWLRATCLRVSRSPTPARTTRAAARPARGSGAPGQEPGPAVQVAEAAGEGVPGGLGGGSWHVRKRGGECLWRAVRRQAAAAAGRSALGRAAVAGGAGASRKRGRSRGWS